MHVARSPLTYFQYFGCNFGCNCTQTNHRCFVLIGLRRGSGEMDRPSTVTVYVGNNIYDIGKLCVRYIMCSSSILYHSGVHTRCLILTQLTSTFFLNFQLATGHKVADLWWQNIELPRR